MESTTDAYEISVESATLTLSKKATAQVNFDDGVVIEVPGRTQPRHLQFFCKTSSDGSSEGCDLRLAKSNRKNTGFLSWPKTFPAATEEQVAEANNSV